MIYSKVKEDVNTNNQDYVGGPVYCLGGRSCVWGLFIPRIDNDTLKTHFPENVTNDLVCGGYYERAERIMTNGEKFKTPPGAKEEYLEKISDAIECVDKIHKVEHVTFAHIAAQFSSKCNYSFPMGAYSTADEVIDLIYNKSKNLVVLLRTEVMWLEEKIEGEKSMTYVSARYSNGQCFTFRTQGSCILCAGTIASAEVIIRSTSLRVATIT